MLRRYGMVVAAMGVFLFTFPGAVWAETKPPLVIADFESGNVKPFEDGTAVTEHATHGQGAMEVRPGKAAKAYTQTGLPKDWSQYDVVKFDVYNPSEQPVTLNIEINDPKGNGYWARHNRSVGLAPGANQVEFSIADLWRGELSRRDMEGFLDPAAITNLVMSAPRPFVVDYVRLEQSAVPKVAVPGLKAFDVGKIGTPVFSGFTALTEKSAYDKAKGFGWTRSYFGRMADQMHPDDLFRDWIDCLDAELAVDVPNGKYIVMLQLEDPGYWEYMQNYTHRTVLAEGKVAIDETMTPAQFKERYFRNQDAEDFPGDDPFEKYVEPRHPWHRLEVEVSDGQLNLAFKSPDAMANTLSAVILYPAEQSSKGDEFMAYVKAMRKSSWSQSWKSAVKPIAPGALKGTQASVAARDGYVLWPMSCYEAMSYNLVPQDDKPIGALEMTATLGDYEPACFGFRATRDVGKVEVSISPLKGPNGRALSADAADVRVGRYRFKRYASNQSALYSIEERELQLFNQTPQNELRCKEDYARRFWITVHVPEDAAPGNYEGSVTLKTQLGGTSTVPLKLSVLNVKLPDPEHLFTMYGLSTLPVTRFTGMEAETRKQREVMFKDLRAHGLNYFWTWDVKVAWDGKKAVVSNADDLDRDLAMIKALGFKTGPVEVPAGCTMNDMAGNGPIRGLPKKQFIEAWHKSLTDFFRARGWPHPFFSYGDEPNLPETLNALTAANNAAHEVSPDIWMGIAYHVQSPEGYELMKTLDVHHLKAFLPAKDFIAAKKYSKFLLNCNVGSTRLAFGLKEWVATKEKQTDGCITYSYTGSHVDLYYGLDAREEDYSQAPPRIDGTRATTAQWEQIREGVDDYRYAMALEALTNNSATSAAVTNQAKQLLQEASDIGGGNGGMPKVVVWRAAVQKLLASQGATRSGL